MSSTALFIWIGVFIGSALGGYLPTLWGDSMFSISSIVCSTLGGLCGVYAGYKISREL